MKKLIKCPHCGHLQNKTGEDKEFKWTDATQVACRKCGELFVEEFNEINLEKKG